MSFSDRVTASSSPSALFDANATVSPTLDALAPSTQAPMTDEAKDSDSGSASSNDVGGDTSFHWTVATVFQSIGVFIAAGLAEIGGGWLVWKAVREDKPAWWAVLGSLILILYGFIPTLQPTHTFGRIYAVYGGFFIVMSFLWGWALDGTRPDIGDAAGGGISLVGVLVVLFWPR